MKDVNRIPIPASDFEKIDRSRHVIIQDETNGRHMKLADPGVLTWKQATMFVTVLAAVVGNVWFMATKFSDLEHAVGSVPELQQALLSVRDDISRVSQVVVSHGEELTAQDKVTASVLEMYREIRTEVTARTQKRYTSDDAAREALAHAQLHVSERRTIDTDLRAIQAEVSSLDKRVGNLEQKSHEPL